MIFYALEFLILKIFSSPIFSHDPPEYDYHSGPPAPSGGSYSYHSTAGTGYGVPPPAPHPHPHPHPPIHPPTGGTGYDYGGGGGGGGGGKKKGGGGKKGRSGTSTITALTLLSFFFFVNLLQGCIKEHMDSMNPTVMVMTTDIRRSSLNKMGDMNSREQHSVSPGVVATGGANLVMQPADMLASAALNSATVMEAMKPYVNLQSPYSGVTNKPLDVMASQPHQQPPPGPGVMQYQPQNIEQPQVSYARPPLYDPHQPDVYEQRPSYGPPPGPVSQNPQYGNPGRPSNHEPPPPYQQQPPIYMGSPMEHATHHHGYDNGNNDYHSPPPTSPPPLYSTPRNPFYDQPNPQSNHNSYKGVYVASQHSSDNGYQKYPPQKYPPQKYQEEEAAPLPGDSYYHSQNQGPVPWSSSQSSSSVVSGPIRRATIVSISPTIKWVSVPSNIDDHTDFEHSASEAEEIRRSSRYDELSFNDKP